MRSFQGTRLLCFAQIAVPSAGAQAFRPRTAGQHSQRRSDARAKQQMRRLRFSAERTNSGPEAGCGALRVEIRESMRPKKNILCVDDNEQVLSVRTFLLETRGYRV